MASFVIHHVAGVEFLKKVEKVYSIQLTEEQKNNFLLGDLIVDSSKIDFQIPKGLESDELTFIKQKYYELIQEEKVSTHFRKHEDKNMCVQVPIVEKFIDKYNNIIKIDFSALGYLFHLYTDQMFFSNLFSESFECLDENNIQTLYIKKLKYIKVKKNGNIYLATDVFNKDSSTSIYNDYTVINKIILDYYNTSFDFNYLYNYANTNFINPGINEVDYKNIVNVLNNTVKYIKQANNAQTSNLSIFDIDNVKLFITIVCTNFILKYSNLLSEIVDYSSKKEVKIKVIN